MTDEADPKKEGEAKAYDAIELGFQEVLQELAGDTALDRFRTEYEKVFRALKRSHDNERRLVARCRELNGEIVAGAAKVQAALQLSEDDQATIAALKKEIENSWRMVDSSHQKELKAKEQIAQLKGEISSLTKLLEQGAAVGLAEEADLEELIRQKEALAAERDGQAEAVGALRSEVAGFAERLRAAEEEKRGLEAEIQGLRDQVAQRRAEAEKELRRRERLEREMKDLRASLEARQQEIRDKQAAVAQSAEYVEKLKGLLRESQQASERLQKECGALAERAARLHHTLEEHIHSNTQLLADNSQRQVEIKAKEDEIRALREEGAKAARAREAMSAKLAALEKQRGDVERTRDELKAEVAGLERELELARRQIAIERRKQEEMGRERERLNKARTTAENATAKHADLVRVAEVMQASLESEAAGYRAELAKQEQTIRGLERDKERLAGEAAAVAARQRAAEEELAARDAAIADLHRKIAEGEARLRAQQDLYEGVRAERNAVSRSLVEVQDEIAELRRRLAVTSHQADQLKGEVAARDASLQREKYDAAKVERDCEALRSELNRVLAAAAAQEAAMAKQRAEITQLQGAIAEADQARQKLQREFSVAVGERDALGLQLVRRNEELRLLAEKAKVQGSALARGQAAYRDRLNEVRALKLKVAALKRELAQLKSSVANADVLRREVHHLNRELLAERGKVKALSEELESPLNVHRWRKLEGADPSAYEMVLKVQALQRRLIAKTEEVVERDLQIQERERLYLELKSILARQPGPEAAEQLSLYQASLREKSKQMKALASELNMYQAQVAEYKHEIERLQREMNEVKKAYFEQRREARGAAAAAAGAKPGAAGGPAAAALPAKAAPGVAALGGAGDLIPAARPAGVSSPGLLASAGPGSAKASPAVSAPAV